MSDWKEHDGGPQPVADDVWVEALDDGLYSAKAKDANWLYVEHYRVLNQRLIDAARLEGIRLGLEAVVKELWAEEDWSDVTEVTELIRALDPETIAKKADQ